MGDYLFSFKIGEVEFGMRRNFCLLDTQGSLCGGMFILINARKEE